MTRTININEVDNSFQAVIALTRNGDEVVIEENGEPLVKITSFAKPEMKQRVLGLGAEKEYFMSDDDFECGIAYVEISEKWGYINRKGNFLFTPKISR